MWERRATVPSLSVYGWHSVMLEALSTLKVESREGAIGDVPNEVTKETK